MFLYNYENNLCGMLKYMLGTMCNFFFQNLKKDKIFRF